MSVQTAHVLRAISSVLHSYSPCIPNIFPHRSKSKNAVWRIAELLELQKRGKGLPFIRKILIWVCMLAGWRKLGRRDGNLHIYERFRQKPPRLNLDRICWKGDGLRHPFRGSHLWYIRASMIKSNNADDGLFDVQLSQTEYLCKNWTDVGEDYSTGFYAFEPLSTSQSVLIVVTYRWIWKAVVSSVSISWLLDPVGPVESIALIAFLLIPCSLNNLSYSLCSVGPSNELFANVLHLCYVDTSWARDILWSTKLSIWVQSSYSNQSYH